MDTEHRLSESHSAEHIHNPSVGHETSDVNVRGIVGFGAGLALCVVLVCFVLYGAFGLLRKGFTGPAVNVNALTGTKEPVPASAEAAAKIFPEPRLQTNYLGDMSAVRSDWRQQMNTYYWVDKNAGVVHIPIERAMALTLQRGLPTREPGKPVPTAAMPLPKLPAAAPPAEKNPAAMPAN